jgi:hypothetical protein
MLDLLGGTCKDVRIMDTVFRIAGIFVVSGRRQG